MLNKKTLFLLLLLMSSLYSCRKENTVIASKYSDELLATFNTLQWDFQNSPYSVYVVINDDQGNYDFSELSSANSSDMIRGELSGDNISLHLIAFDKLDPAKWEMISFYDFPSGKEIDLSHLFDTRLLGKRTVSAPENRINISFADIPEFDVATRSAHYSRHSHTLNTLTVPCAANGDDTYPVGDNFYVCLQKGDQAGFVLQNIDEQRDYQISLNELDYNMKKYTIGKRRDISTNVLVYGNSGAFEIFDLRSDDVDIFRGENIDIFVPADPSLASSFTTTYFSKGDKPNSSRSSKYYDNKVVTDYAFINSGLELINNTGFFPSIKVRNRDYDFIKGSVRTSSVYEWTFYSPGDTEFYIPVIPSEIVSRISDHGSSYDLFNSFKSINLSVNELSYIENYNGMIDYLTGAMEIINMENPVVSLEEKITFTAGSI